MQKPQGWIPGLGRSPGGGSGNPLQYSCLENPVDRGAWLESLQTQRVGHDGVTKHAHTHILHTVILHLKIISFSMPMKLVSTLGMIFHKILTFSPYVHVLTDSLCCTGDTNATL